MKQSELDGWRASAEAHPSSVFILSRLKMLALLDIIAKNREALTLSVKWLPRSSDALQKARAALALVEPGKGE